jgi:hypothetical protein
MPRMAIANDTPPYPGKLLDGSILREFEKLVRERGVRKV